MSECSQQEYLQLPHNILRKLRRDVRRLEYLKLPPAVIAQALLDARDDVRLLREYMVSSQLPLKSQHHQIIVEMMPLLDAYFDRVVRRIIGGHADPDDIIKLAAYHEHQGQALLSRFDIELKIANATNSEREHRIQIIRKLLEGQPYMAYELRDRTFVLNFLGQYHEQLASDVISLITALFASADVGADETVQEVEMQDQEPPADSLQNPHSGRLALPIARETRESLQRLALCYRNLRELTPSDHVLRDTIMPEAQNIASDLRKCRDWFRISPTDFQLVSDTEFRLHEVRQQHDYLQRVHTLPKKVRRSFVEQAMQALNNTKLPKKEITRLRGGLYSAIKNRSLESQTRLERLIIALLLSKHGSRWYGEAETPADKAKLAEVECTIGTLSIDDFLNSDPSQAINTDRGERRGVSTSQHPMSLRPRPLKSRIDDDDIRVDPDVTATMSYLDQAMTAAGCLRPERIGVAENIFEVLRGAVWTPSDGREDLVVSILIGRKSPSALASHPDCQGSCLLNDLAEPLSVARDALKSVVARRVSSVRYHGPLAEMLKNPHNLRLARNEWHADEQEKKKLPSHGDIITGAMHAQPDSLSFIEDGSTDGAEAQLQAELNYAIVVDEW